MRVCALLSMRYECECKCECDCECELDCEWCVQSGMVFFPGNNILLLPSSPEVD